MTADRDVVLVFVRAPQRGMVKTRLAAALGDDDALAVYRRLAERTLEQVRRARPAGQVRVLYTPADAGARVEAWLGGGVVYRPQTDGDLGQRLESALAEAFAAGARRVVVVGSDLPALTAGLVRHAFAVLRHHAAVLGPAHDGGYYLLGLREPRPELFRDMAWSTPCVFAETRARLRAGGAEPVLLPTLADIDYADDLPAWGEWGRYRAASRAGSAPSQ